jgi:YjbE family integral membrane protein
MEQFMTMVNSPAFWLAAGQIVLIDILLGGDNAILIALACRNLPPKQRKWGIIWGTAGAIVLRVILIIFALKLLAMPYLKLVGGILLFWIGIKLITGDDEHGEVKGSDKLLAAVWTIIVADLVMSVDNVLGIASAAQGANPDHQMFLIVFGLLVSIPIIVWGSQFVIKLMEKFPIVITLGAGLLGWLAGGMLVTDPAVAAWFTAHVPNAPTLAGVIGALLVVAVAKWLTARKKAPTTT